MGHEQRELRAAVREGLRRVLVAADAVIATSEEVLRQSKKEDNA